MHRFQWAAATPKAETGRPHIWRSLPTPERGLDGIEHLFPRPLVVPAPIMDTEIFGIESVLQPTSRPNKQARWNDLWERLESTVTAKDAIRVSFKSLPALRSAMNNMLSRVGARNKHCEANGRVGFRSQRDGENKLLLTMWLEPRLVPLVPPSRGGVIEE